MAADFEQQSYWHDRFRSETAFEWLLSSADFEWLLSSADFLRLLDGPVLAALPRSAPILHVGAGTSDLHNHLRRRGFLDVTNVDYEPLAADRGRELERRAFGDVRMRYAVADATRDLAGAGGSFRLVLDKSTSDAVACGGDEALRSMCDRVRGCIAPSGVWIALSFSEDRFRLSGLPFDVEVLAKVPTPKARESDPDVFYWCYCLRPR